MRKEPDAPRILPSIFGIGVDPAAGSILNMLQGKRLLTTDTVAGLFAGAVLGIEAEDTETGQALFRILKSLLDQQAELLDLLDAQRMEFEEVSDDLATSQAETEEFRVRAAEADASLRIARADQLALNRLKSVGKILPPADTELSFADLDVLISKVCESPKVPVNKIVVAFLRAKNKKKGQSKKAPKRGAKKR